MIVDVGVAMVLSVIVTAVLVVNMMLVLVTAVFIVHMSGLAMRGVEEVGLEFVHPLQIKRMTVQDHI